MQTLLTLIVFCAALLAFTSQANNSYLLVEQPSQYKGKLFYIDYSSGKEVNIPMSFMLYQSADNRNLVIDKVYTDPGFKVYSMSVFAFDFAAKSVIETVYENNEITTKHFTLDAFEYDSVNNWTVTRSTLSEDNSRKAKVMSIDKMKDGVFTTETLVDFLDTPENENLKRNWVKASMSN